MRFDFDDETELEDAVTLYSMVAVKGEALHGMEGNEMSGMKDLVRVSLFSFRKQKTIFPFP
jgi:hypothetical protein